MNVTCTGCPAKYAVPDEKVRGKKVRITCKHCGTNIVVDGSALGADPTVAPKPAPSPAAVSVSPSMSDAASVKPSSAASAQPSAASAQPSAASAQPSAASAQPSAASAQPSAASVQPSPPVPELAFIVGFPDDRQETYTLTEIVELYRAGKIDEEALVWKDGMADWLSPFEVPELAAALGSTGFARQGLNFGLPMHTEDEPTLVVRSPLEDHEVALAAAARATAAVPAAPPAPNPSTAVAPVTTVSSAARRAEKRPGGVDLFGSVAEAGSERDPSLEFGSRDEAHKLTGARNESSVLFSLDALTQGEARQKQKQKSRADEQEKQDSLALFGDDAPNSLLNLGGGGLAALSAADFSKPLSALEGEPAQDPLQAPAPTKQRAGIVLLVALLGIAAVAAVGFVMMQRRPSAPPPAATTNAPEAQAKPTEAAPVTPPLASTEPAPGATATTEPTSPTPSAPATNTSASAVPAASPAPTAENVAPPKPAVGSAQSAAASKQSKPGAAAVPAEPPPPASEPGGAEGPAFDKGAAVAALGAAAASASSCKKPDGPTGSGKVSVTFAPSGRATATNVAGALAGTEVGGCVARLFRAAKVPAFAGEPVTVTKSFTVE